jgi:hypothetical protein
MEANTLARQKYSRHKLARTLLPWRQSLTTDRGIDIFTVLKQNFSYTINAAPAAQCAYHDVHMIFTLVQA